MNDQTHPEPHDIPIAFTRPERAARPIRWGEIELCPSVASAGGVGVRLRRRDLYPGAATAVFG